MPSSASAPPPLAALAVAALLLLAAGLAVAAGPDPLLPNGGFESGDSGWTSRGGQLEIVSDPVRTGSHAGRLASSGVNLIAFTESGFMTITAGTVYTVTGAVYYTGTALAGAQLMLTWYTDTAASPCLSPPGPPRSSLLPPPGSPLAPLIATPPAGARFAKLQALVGLAGLDVRDAAVFDDLAVRGEPHLPRRRPRPPPPHPRRAVPRRRRRRPPHPCRRPRPRPATC